MIIANYESTESELEDTGIQGTVIYLQKPHRRMVYAYISTIVMPFTNDRFFLSVPYSIFRINYYKSDDGLFSTKNRLIHLAFAENDKLINFYRPPFPNIFNDLNVCCDPPSEYYENLEDLCKGVVHNFWSSTFSYVDRDYDPCALFASYSPSIAQYNANSLLANYDEWQKKTKNEPEWIPTAEEMLECIIDKKLFFSAAARNHLFGTVKYFDSEGEIRSII